MRYKKDKLIKGLVGFSCFLSMAFFAPAVAQTQASYEEQAAPLLTEKLADGMTLSGKNHQRVEARVRQYKNNNSVIFSHLDSQRLAIFNYIVSELEARDMPLELAFVPLVESSYQPNATNRGLHIGLWQLGAPTARSFGVPVNNQVDGRLNVARATEGALDYLEYLNNMFNGDWLLTLAAYNAGEGRVLNSIRRNRNNGKPTDYWNLQLPKITMEYVPKILALSKMALNESRLKRPTTAIPKLILLQANDKNNLVSVINDLELDVDQLQFYNPNYSASRDGLKMLLVSEQQLNL